MNAYMNVHYLKRLRRKANREYQLQYFNNDRYYVAMNLGRSCFYAVSDLGTYEDTVKELQRLRRGYILNRVHAIRSVKNKCSLSAPLQIEVEISC